MVLTDSIWARMSNAISVTHCVGGIITAVVAYYTARAIYNVYFHPLAKYPGPRLAAMTDLWWAYASLSGKYPWMIEKALEQYGDVVRIAPNELVFITPQAAKDIYLAQEKNLELFVQVGYDALDTGDGGISGETNPVRHREIAKKLAPAFSTRNLRAKEGAVQKHIDLFVQKMKEEYRSATTTAATTTPSPPPQAEGLGKAVEMQRWTDWLALDLSADMTYGNELGQVRDMKDSVLLKGSLKMNFFLTMSQLTRKFALLGPLIYLTVPPSIWLLMPQLINMNSQDVQARLARQGKTEHLDYFEQLVPADQPKPHDKKQLYHLENVAGQLLIAGWQPLANQFYSCIFFLLKEGIESGAYAALVREVRDAFEEDAMITFESTAGLKYLQACVNESLRLHQDTVDGLPRISPGAVVDGTYIPQGVTCQISYFAAARSPRFFADPVRFRPERWLTADHPSYDAKYQNDNLKASKPFSQGLRGCPGGAIASAVVRLFLAKIIWQFDLEPAPGLDRLSFDKDFKFMAFWERPPFWVRFKAIPRPS